MPVGKASASAPAGGKSFDAPVLFKDYNKATSDFLTKNFQKANSWKIESKFKGPKDTFFVNPSASNDGKMDCSVEYAPSSCGAAVKVNVTPGGLDNLKTTASYNIDGHKIEAVLHKKGEKEFDYEISHETTVLMGKRMSLNEKLTKNDVTLGLGVDVAPHCQVGCGAVYTLKGKQCNWSVGCRYYQNGIEAAVHTRRLAQYISSFSMPFNMQMKSKTITVNVAAETTCGHGEAFDATMGCECACPLFPSNIVKARVSRNMDWAIAYIAKLADNWTVSVSLDKQLKPGVLLSHS